MGFPFHTLLIEMELFGFNPTNVFGFLGKLEFVSSTRAHGSNLNKHDFGSTWKEDCVQIEFWHFRMFFDGELRFQAKQETYRSRDDFDMARPSEVKGVPRV